jgi:hypothetical protein
MFSYLRQSIILVKAHLFTLVYNTIYDQKFRIYAVSFSTILTLKNEPLTTAKL